MIESVELRNFRNHAETRLDFSPSLTLIHGPNGAGKTSVLEAIYCLYRGSGFKGGDRDLVRENAGWFRVDLCDDDGLRRLSYEMSDGRVSKRFTIDDKEYARLPAKYKRPIVLFSPDDLLLLTGSPSRRRRYIDTIIAQINPHYSATLRKYERALVQRNKLLKSPMCTPDLLFSWNVLLSELGTVVISERVGIVEYINASLTSYYQAISRTSDTLSVAYSHERVTPQQLLSSLDEQYGRDRLLGSTSTGPHRHDMNIQMNGRPALSIASRGENRTIILALKQIEVDYIAKITKHAPIILLDDVLGELDDSRQRELVESAFAGHQIIITSVSRVDIQSDAMTVELA